METEDKIRFEEYDIEFSEDDFENLSDEELEECKKIIEDIKRQLDQ